MDRHIVDRRHFLTTAGAALFAVPLAGRAAPAATADDGTVRLRDLYNKDLSFADYATERSGQRVSVSGFMAPPLKADAKFFVLTKRPLAVCPFCDHTVDWPLDILAIYLARPIEHVPFNVGIVARGTLELGDFVDPETGFLSRVRLAGAAYARG